MPGSVLMVGAGMSGIATTYIFSKFGNFLEIVCIDRHDDTGGCWIDAFDFVDLQSSKNEYHFPGTPCPSTTPDVPGKQDVLTYFRNFIKANDLSQYMLFRTTLTSLLAPRAEEPNHRAPWTATLSTTSDKNTPPRVTKRHFDFVVVATGLFGSKELSATPSPPPSRQPPRLPCPPRSSCRRPGAPSPSSRVVCVGFGPTALAFARRCAVVTDPAAGGATHLVVRDARWYVPRKLLGYVPHTSVLYNRLAAMWTPGRRFHTVLERALHGIAPALVRAFWTVLSGIVHLSAPPPPALPSPREGLGEALRNAIPVLPDGLFEQCRAGRVRCRADTVERVEEGGQVVLSTGEVLERVDRVIWGTGYQLDGFEWMEEGLRCKVLGGRRRKQLYRYMVVPGVERLAFIGFGSGFMGCVTEYVMATWVLAWFNGWLRLPSVGEMEKDSEEELKWKKENLVYEAQVPYATGARFCQHIDQLWVDMVLPIKRKGWLESLIHTWGSRREDADVPTEMVARHADVSVRANESSTVGKTGPGWLLDLPARWGGILLIYPIFVLSSGVDAVRVFALLCSSR